MKQLDDVKEFDRQPKNWGHMSRVSVNEDRMGSLTITFEDQKEIFAQFEADIDEFIDSLAYILEEDSYYILDEYHSIAV